MAKKSTAQACGHNFPQDQKLLIPNFQLIIFIYATILSLDIFYTGVINFPYNRINCFTTDVASNKNQEIQQQCKVITKNLVGRNMFQ